MPDVLAAHTTRGQIVLVDCLTLWLSNLMAEKRPIETATDSLVQALDRATGSVILVSNEVGQGIVPTNALARTFIDHSGRLHQAVARAARSVILVNAGIPHSVK